MLSVTAPETPPTDLNATQKALLTRILALWTSHKAPESIILSSTNLEPPSEGAAFAPGTPSRGTSSAPVS